MERDDTALEGVDLAAEAVLFWDLGGALDVFVEGVAFFGGGLVTVAAPRVIRLLFAV